MTTAIIRELEKAQLRADLPDFRAGDNVRVQVKIKEGDRERLQAFEGTVLRRAHGGARETFTVRRVSHGIGVERTFLLHSPSIQKVELVRRGQVRRSKLYYLRQRVGKKAKVKEHRDQRGTQA